MRFDVFATRLLLVAAAALAATSVVQTDFWWLLRAGRDIWRTGRVSLVEHYSYTAAGRFWPNHEWLWEAVAYGVHQVGGMPLLAVLVAATVVTTLLVVLRLSPATGYVVPAVLVLVLPLLSVSWTMRPQVTSLLLFAVTMLLLARERYLLVPAVFLIWANLHAQVVMGGVLLAASLLVAVVRWARFRRPVERGRVTRLGAATAVSALATLATPLGPRLWAYVADANGRPGQQAIAEWHNAFEVNGPVLLFWAVVATAVVSCVRRRDRLSSWSAQVPVAAALAMAPLAILAVRNIPFLALAAAPLLMTTLEFTPARPISNVPHARVWLGAIGTVALCCVVGAWTVLPAGLGWRPVPPALATAVRQCPGHLFNGYGTGAALVWWVPETKVFVDNRQDPYPARVIDTLFELTPATYPQVFARYGIRCAFLAPGNPLGPTLRRDGWQNAYAGDEGSVWWAPAEPRATAATE